MNTNKTPHNKQEMEKNIFQGPVVQSPIKLIFTLPKSHTHHFSLKWHHFLDHPKKKLVTSK